MHTPQRKRLLRKSPFLLAGLPLLLPACLVNPPSALVHAQSGVVRGATEAEAQNLGCALDRLRPAVLELVPGTRVVEGLEVWIQDQPGLYAFPHPSHGEAEGLWAESHERILLSRDADDLQRTLAHELVHASLDDSWHTLPGTLEEGLADVISTRLVPEGAPRLRAGRLASAALATGGLALTIEVENPRLASNWMARIHLSGTRPSEHPQRDVFKLAAGLSSTKVAPAAKRGYYGLAYLLVQRVVDRKGLDHLHALCTEADAAGLSQIPRPQLLAAAGLADTPDAWRDAALEGMGTEELRELLRMHPDFVLDAVAGHLRTQNPQDLASLNIRLSLRESGATLDLGHDAEFLAALGERLSQ
ncbi:MAG: hypothetical protein R3F17_00645 [Planctomycetota bacterium]